jgi:hypothetical protein
VRAVKAQLHDARFLLPAIAVAVAACLYGIVLLAEAQEMRVSAFTRDPAATLDIDNLAILSNLGIILWATAAGIALGGAWVLRESRLDREASSFLLVSGLVSLFLTLDDGLMFHDHVFLNYLLIPQPIIYGFYCLSIFAWLVRFRSTILDTDWLLLGFSLAAMAVSMAMDSVLPLTEDYNFVEDGFKFAGILLWLAYFAKSVSRLARVSFASRN